jgi:NADPH-dependent curcumin reductase CurA
MTTRAKCRRIVLAARPKGNPCLTDFRLEEGPVPEPADGELLLETRWLSLDPYMRGRMSEQKSYSEPTPVGGVMEGEVIAEVTKSRNARYAVGDFVQGRIGWLTHTVSDGAGLTRLDRRIQPITAALGTLGMPGITAYAGLLSIGKPKLGETVVVAAASGPVGSLVGQIARIKGARAVGIAGGAEKCAFVKQELNFDAVVDHYASDFPERLLSVCPDGIDVYFESVGGKVWQAVLPLLNDYARIPVCGLISQYNGADEAGPDRLPATMQAILTRRLIVRGYLWREFVEQRDAFLDEVSTWIAEGRVRYREHVVDGFEQAPKAFIEMLQGKNFGKLLIRVAPLE